MQAVRDSEWEGREIARMRNSQEQVISLETPYYDICRVQVGTTLSLTPQRVSCVDCTNGTHAA